MQASISMGRTDRLARFNGVPFFLQDAISSEDYPPAPQFFRRPAPCAKVDNGLRVFFSNALK